MAKRQLTPEFREFLVCLNRAGVEYLPVGGEDLSGLDKTFLQQHEALFLGAVPNKMKCSSVAVDLNSRRLTRVALKPR